MNIFKRFRGAAALCAACVLWALASASAAVPERISYQGTLRKDGILFSGTVPMEFRVTNANGGIVYWTSSSTDVVVSGGLFRYTLGSPNEAAFEAVQWNQVDAYVQVLLDGGWLPPEPLYSSAYALNAKTADGSLGDFTVREGNIKISTTAGNIGLVFQDGTTQYTSASPVWTVSGSDVYISSVTYGNAGVGNAQPQARLDVQAATGGYPQIWRDSSGVIRASMTAAGFLYADGSQLRNLPPSADSLGTHVATQTLNMGGYQLSNAGAVTASSYTATGTAGVGAVKLRFSSNVEVSSTTAARYGGVYVSSNIYIAGRYYGDGSQISNLPIPANIMTLDTNQTVSGLKTYTSSLTVTAATGLRAPRYDLAAGVALASATAAQYGGVYVSTHVYLQPGARYYGDGSQLSGVVGLDNLGDHTLGQNLVGGAYWFSGDGGNEGVKVDATGNVSVGGSGSTPAAKLDVRGSYNNYIQVWRNTAGTIESSMTATGVLYADGSGLRNTGLGNHTASQDLNMAGRDIVSVSTISVSTITSAGAGVFFSTNLFVMNGNVGISTTTPQEKLVVNGNILSSNLSGAANRCVYVDNMGVLRAKGSDCGTASGGDDLGNHTMTQNITAASNWISYGGTNAGLMLDASNNVGVGATAWALGSRLDVKASGTAPSVMAQIWRDSGGTIKSSMSATGVMMASKFIGSGAGLTGIGDSLGTHVATQTLNLGGYGLINVASVTGSGYLTISSATMTGIGLGAAQLRLANNVIVSSETLTPLGAGVRISSNVYIVGFASATRYFGDGSGLTGVAAASGGGDSLGTHIATKTLTMGGFDMVGVSTVTLSSIAASGAQITMSSNLSLSDRDISDVYTLSVSTIASPGTEVVLDSDLQVKGALDVRGGGIKIGNTSVTDGGTIRWSGTGYEGYFPGVGWQVLNGAYVVDASTYNWAQGVNETIFSQGTSSNVAIGFTDSGGTNKLRVRGATTDFTANALLAENSGGTALLTVRNDGNVGVGVANPSVKLDVNGAVNATAYTGDGSALTGISGDDLGSHTAANDLNLNSYALIGAGSVTASSYTATSSLGVRAAKLSLAGGVELSSASVSEYGGLYVSTNIYITGKYYGDGSELTGVATSGGGDDLGSHIATQTLTMSAYDIIGVSTITVSSIAASGSGVTVSANLIVAGGSIQNTNMAGFGSRCVHANNSGVLSLTADDCGSAAGMDGLGDHTLQQNLVTGTNWISYDGAADGLVLDSNQNLGVGQPAPGARLDVFGPGGGGNYTQIWRNSSGLAQASMTVTGILYADGSQLRNLPAGDNMGTHTASQNIQLETYWLSGDGDNEGLAVDSSGNVGVNMAVPSARLDVNGSVAGYTQLWREGGVIQASMTSTGILYADGSRLRNLPAADNLGNHTATANLNMGAYQITGSGSVTVSSYTALSALGVGSAKLKLASNVEISSTTAARYGGVYVSSNLYVAGKYYGDGSQLTGVTGMDNLGDHTATLDLNMAGKDIVSVSTISVSSITSAGGSVTMSANFYLAGGDIQSTKLAGSGTRCLRVNNSGLINMAGDDCGTVAGNDNMGDHTMTQNLETWNNWISHDGSDSGLSVNASSNVGVGILSAGTRLDVQPDIGDGYAQFWRNGAGTIMASMTASGVLFADGSMLRNLAAGADDLGDHTATMNLNMATFNINNVQTLTATSGVNAPQAVLAVGVSVSSEAAPDLGGGVRVSSNIYIMGFSSATRYYGDGSALTGIVGGGGSGFPSPVAENLDMAGYDLIGVSTLTVSSITTNASAIIVSTNMYIYGNAFATKYYGNGGSLTGISATAFPNPVSEELNMNNYGITQAANISVTGTMTALKFALGNDANKTNIELTARPTGGIAISTPTYLSGFVVTSSHTVTGNNATAVLANTAVLINEAYAEADITSSIIGLTAIALSSPTADHATNAMVIGGNFRGGINAGNTKNYDTLVGLKSGSWSQTTGQVTNAIGIRVQNEQTAAGNTVNNYGILVETPTITGGTITNYYGIYLKDPGTAMTNNFNIFSKGLTAKNVFEGMVAIGDTSASTPAQTAPLQIKTNSSNEVIRIDNPTNPAKYCVIRFSASDSCSGVGGVIISSHNFNTLCLECN